MTTTCLIYDSFMTIDDFRLAIEKNSSLKTKLTIKSMSNEIQSRISLY